MQPLKKTIKPPAAPAAPLPPLRPIVAVDPNIEEATRVAKEKNIPYKIALATIEAKQAYVVAAAKAKFEEDKAAAFFVEAIRVAKMEAEKAKAAYMAIKSGNVKI